MQTTDSQGGQAPQGNADIADGQAPDAHAEPAETPVATADVSALQAELDKYKAEAQRARDEAASRRVKAREESEAKARAQKEQGEFKALAETLQAQLEEAKAQLAEAEALREKASAFDSWQERELQQVEEAKKGLPAEVAAALDAAESLTAKKAILAAFQKQGPSARVSQHAGSGGASASRQVDFDALSGRALTNAIKEDPQAYWASRGVGAANKVGSSLGRLLGAGKG